MDRLLVILDLDETLVYAADTPLSTRPDFTAANYAVYRRPHLDAFLQGLREQYRLAVWTASGRSYAEAVVSQIMPWHAELAFFWSAERCTQHFDHETRDRTTIKKLHKVKQRGYDLGRVVVVDDSPEKHIRNYGNLLHVTRWEGAAEDQELPAALDFIHNLASAPNVRAIEKRFWRTTQ